MEGNELIPDAEFEIVRSDFKTDVKLRLSWNAFDELMDDMAAAFSRAGQSEVTGVYPLTEDSYVMAQCLAAKLGTTVCHNPISGCVAVKPVHDVRSALLDTLTVATWVRYAGDDFAPDYSYLTIDKGTEIVFPWGK